MIKDKVHRLTEKEVDEVLNTIAPNEVTHIDTKIVDDAVNKLLDPNRVITDCEACKARIRADARAEIHTALIDEMAMLNEAGLTENNLKTFAYRVKDIVEQLEEKRK